MPVAVLFILAVASIGIYGIVLGGWSSGSTYSLLGGLRSSAQMISYEVAMGLALVAVFLYAGSMSTSQIVAAQDDLWFGLILLPSFVIYMISMVGETNRAPFDLPEAEGELVGGFHTEYSSLKFALFFLAEYINMATVSALATTLFLGGWHAPSGSTGSGRAPTRATGRCCGSSARCCSSSSSSSGCAASLPRLRYDQFMAFGWKRLIPISLVWIVAVGTIRAITLEGQIDRQYLLIGIGVLAVLFLLLFFVGEDEETRPRPRPAPPRRDAVRRAATPSRRCPRAAPSAAPRHRWRSVVRRASLCRHRASTRRRPTTRSDRWLTQLPSSSEPQGAVLGPGRRASASRSGPCSGRSSPSSTPSRSCRPRRASTAATSSTAGPTAWRSASAASCAPGPARPTRSTSRAPPTPTDERFSPGERYGRVYQINYLRCILCGLCIEACPTRALTMTNEYELADNNRADLIYEKSDLLAPLLPGMEQPPHPMRLGDDEGDYYRGKYRPARRPTDRGGGDAMIAFWILAPIMVLAALGILFVRKAVHAALLLAVVMIGLAVLYAVLDAPFLFAVQIIVYTGAILMLFLFVVMLVGVDASDSVVETIRGQRVMATSAACCSAWCWSSASARSPSAPSSGSTRPTPAATSRRWPTSCSPATSSPSRPPAPC